MSYLDWHVGMKVVCVDATNVSFAPIYLGKVYILRGIRPDPETGGISVLLEGIKNEVHPISGIECGYYARRFRPLQTRKTDISCFTALLTPKKQRVRA